MKLSNPVHNDEQKKIWKISDTKKGEIVKCIYINVIVNCKLDNYYQDKKCVGKIKSYSHTKISIKNFLLSAIVEKLLEFQRNRTKSNSN